MVYYFIHQWSYPMKKIILVALLSLSTTLVACGKSQEQQKADEAQKAIDEYNAKKKANNQ